MLENLIYFGVVFVLITLLYLLFVNRRRLKKLGVIKSKKGPQGTITDKTVRDLGEVSYVIVKFKLDKAKINFKELLTVCAFINAFIIAFTCMVISAIPLQFLWKLMIGFVILFVLVYAIYEIYGRILIKRGWQK